MVAKKLKSLLFAVFCLFIIFSSNVIRAQHETGAETTKKGTPVEREEKIDAARIIMEHVMDNHEFHFAEFSGHPVSIPLPIILYSPQRGFDAFMSSNLQHGHPTYHGYKMENDKVVAVNDAGQAVESIKVYDFSLTRNVVQMLLAVILLLLVMLTIAKKYRTNGINKAPTGFQNAI